MKVTGGFHQEDNSYFTESDDAKWLVFSAAKTAWYTVWPDICTAGIKHLRWRTSATLLTAKPVNHSELSKQTAHMRLPCCDAFNCFAV